ncbi:MAG: hypothetical protein KKG01_03075 [Candidatus Omnitrophica bacterium]|nr:hypothetical protein [Candidatus Omnitrophota bacterium]
MDKNYKFLGISARIFKVLAWVSGVVGIISAIVIFIGGGTPDAPRATGFIGLLLGIVYFFIFFVTAEIITLLLELRSKVNKDTTV